MHNSFVVHTHLQL